MPKTFVNLDNTRRRPDSIYKSVIQKIRDDGICPFCPEHFRRYHEKPVIKTGKHWILTENMYPYKGAQHHIILIHKKHIESLSEVAPEAWSELLRMAKAEVKKRAVAGGTLYMRFGDPAATGASVAHLHANLISPDLRQKNREPILARVG